MYTVPCPPYWSDKISVLNADRTDEVNEETRQALRQLPGVKSAKMIRKRLVYVKLNGLVDIETVIKSANGLAGVARIEKLQGAQTPTRTGVASSSWTIRPGSFGWSCVC